MNTAKLDTWKPNFVRCKNFSMLILASRGSGKSYLTKYLLEYHLRDKFDLFVVISDSEDELENYREILPGKLFFNDFNPEIINKIIAMNKQRQSVGRPLLQVLFLFDDKISNKMKYNDELLQLFTRGRHVGISIIFISQSHTFAQAAWRNNSDKIILLKQNAKQARDAINDNILIGSIDVPDNEREKPYYMRIMREYLNAEGDALVLDFDRGAFNNLYRYRAPKIDNKKRQTVKPIEDSPRPVPQPPPPPLPVQTKKEAIEELTEVVEKTMNGVPDLVDSSYESDDDSSDSGDWTISFLQ